MVVLRQDLVGHGQGIGTNVDGPEDAIGSNVDCLVKIAMRIRMENGELGRLVMSTAATSKSAG